MADQDRFNRYGTDVNNDYTASEGVEVEAEVNRNFSEVAPDEVDMNRNYQEETAAEIAAPVSPVARFDREETETAGRGLGFTALALSIISLFVLPILFGAAGIILGFVARRRGSTATGNWAIGIGAVSIIVGIFILPFF